MNKGGWPYLICDIDVHIFTEGITFRQASGTVLHQVESLQGPKGSEQLLDLMEKEETMSTVVIIPNNSQIFIVAWYCEDLN